MTKCVDLGKLSKKLEWKNIIICSKSDKEYLGALEILQNFDKESLELFLLDHNPANFLQLMKTAAKMLESGRPYYDLTAAELAKFKQIRQKYYLSGEIVYTDYFLGLQPEELESFYYNAKYVNLFYKWCILLPKNDQEENLASFFSKHNFTIDYENVGEDGDGGQLQTRSPISVRDYQAFSDKRRTWRKEKFFKILKRAYSLKIAYELLEVEQLQPEQVAGPLKQLKAALKKLTLAGVERASRETVIDENRTGEIYKPMLQGKGTNALAHTDSKKIKRERKELTRGQENSKISYDTENGVMIIFPPSCVDNMNVNTWKVLDLITLKYTAMLPGDRNKYQTTAESTLNNRRLRITIDEYLHFTGTRDRKEANRNIVEAVETLYDISVKFIEPRYNKRKKKVELKKFDLRILEKKEETGKAVDGAEVYLSASLAEYLASCNLMMFSENLDKINAHTNPYSYYMGRKLEEYYNMNIAKKNANIISVRALLAAVPNMPVYDPTIGRLEERIIGPFERDLDALTEPTEKQEGRRYGVLSKWEYCNSNGEPLTDEQLGAGSYESFMERLIYFELADYPEAVKAKRLQAIEARRA